MNNRLGALRAALIWCVKIGDLPTLPCQIELLRVGRKRRRILTKEEVGTLIKYARPPFNLIIRIAAFAGLRHQEILHLTRENIDFIDGKSWVTAKNEPHQKWSPKSYHERSIPMHRTELESHLVNWLDRGAGENWLFPGLEPGHPRKDVCAPTKRIFIKTGFRTTWKSCPRTRRILPTSSSRSWEGTVRMRKSTAFPE